MRTGELDTPRLLLDRRKLQANLARMQARADALGVRLRPHLKTAKCAEVAHLAAPGPDARLTVSTLMEAEQFFATGFTDILYAVGISPEKLARVARLRRRGCDLTIILDSVAAAEAVLEAGLAEGLCFPVMIEIDTDGHRSGVTPEAPLLLQIGERLATDPAAARLRGVMTHAGESYGCSTWPALQAIAEQECVGAVRAADRLRAAGHACHEVSVGSTPTALAARDLTGVTELRAGVYMMFDLVMAGVGVCAPEDIALSVLATVIGRQAERGWVIIDAGWMALSRDRGTDGQAVDQGYGLVCDEAGAVLDDLIVRSVNQEHGVIGRRDGGAFDLDLFPLGRRLRILPNHACATATMHPGYDVLEADTEISAYWRRFSGW